MSHDETVDRLVEDFNRFVEEQYSNMDIIKQRVATIVSLLNDPAVARYPLHVKIGFLNFKSFSSAEIESALENTNERDYMRYLEALSSGEPMELALIESMSHKDGKVGAASNQAAGGAADIMATSGLSNFNNGGADNGASGGGEAAFWRVGAIVYAFKGDGCYYPVPFVGLDMSRAEDFLMARHQLPSGEYGPIQYFTSGFKGAVPDEFAPYDLVLVGMTVIAEYPNAYRNHLREAVILSKSAVQADGGYLVDLEWVHDSSVQRSCEFRIIRLLSHPKRMLEEQQQAAKVRSQSQAAARSYHSTTSFLPVPATQPPTALMASMSPIVSEIPDYIKNFIKFPHLDKGVQPRTLRNGAQFVTQFGQFYYDQGIKSFPMLPQSQAEGTMSGFGFVLTHLERHPGDHRYYCRNPTVDICDEAFRNDAMFVDPDFPPSFYSITGRPDEIPSGVVWRRCSEIFSKPRIFTVGSKAIDIRPGRYSPSWLLGLLYTLQGVAELEEMISPESDGWAFGVYTVKLFLDGQWVFTVVDDFIPCDEATGEPLSCISASPGEIYCTIIEKVLAKLAGSYGHLRYSPASTPANAWEDLTSNALETVEHRLLIQKDSLSENLYAIVTSGANARVIASVRGEDRFNDVGFHKSDHWIVDAVAQYIPPGRRAPLYFFHVCRPTHVGSVVPYLESHKEKFYAQFPPDAVDHFPTRGVRDDGITYWISSADYFTIFDRTIMFWFFNNTQRAVIPASFKGRPTAAPKMFGPSRWLANPQIFLGFVQPTDVIIEVKLLDRRLNLRTADWEERVANESGPTSLQVSLIRGLPIERRVTEETEYVASSQVVDLREDEDARHHPSAIIRATLQGGHYILVPSLGEGHMEDILVKVFSVSAFHGKILN